MEGNSTILYRDSLNKSFESNSMFSVEEIEQKIQQLITENTELRSMFLEFDCTRVSYIKQ